MPFSSLYISATLAGLSLLLASCGTDNKKDQELIRLMEEKLKNSSYFISQTSSGYIRSLEEKKQAPETSNKATYWLPIADYFYKKNRLFIAELENLKKNDKADNASIYSIIDSFIINIKKIDPIINNQFKEKITALHNLKQSKNTSHIGAFIESVKNELILTENKILIFCNEKCMPGCNLFSTSFSVLLGQNSLNFTEGQYLELNSGVGSYSRAARSVLIVNQNRIESNGEGFSTYKLKIKDKPGRYSLPVKIEYYDEGGEKIIKDFKIHYTVNPSCH
jgi:hypothetical protein